MARLFEQSGETTPGNLADRLAYGRSGVPTKNITLQNFVNWVSSVISALRPSNNLSDVDDVALAQDNLNVYPQEYIDTELDLKADKTNVLEKDNTTSYTPTQDYHPATKLSSEQVSNASYSDITSWGANVDNTTGKVSLSDNVVHFTGKFDDNGLQDGDTVFTLPASIPAPLVDVYVFCGNASGGGAARCKITSGSKSAIVEDQESATNATLSFNDIYLTASV